MNCTSGALSMLQSLIFTALLGIVFFLARYFQADTWIHPNVGYMLLFFLAISYLIHRLMAFGIKNEREKFVEFYLSTVVMRLLLCIAFVGISFFLGIENVPLFIGNFFALYLFYTSFEIYGLYRNLRRDS